MTIIHHYQAGVLGRFPPCRLQAIASWTERCFKSSLEPVNISPLCSAMPCHTVFVHRMWLPVSKTMSSACLPEERWLGRLVYCASRGPLGGLPILIQLTDSPVKDFCHRPNSIQNTCSGRGTWCGMASPPGIQPRSAGICGRCSPRRECRPPWPGCVWSNMVPLPVLQKEGSPSLIVPYGRWEGGVERTKHV